MSLGEGHRHAWGDLGGPGEKAPCADRGQRSPECQPCPSKSPRPAPRLGGDTPARSAGLCPARLPHSRAQYPRAWEEGDAGLSPAASSLLKQVFSREGRGRAARRRVGGVLRSFQTYSQATQLHTYTHILFLHSSLSAVCTQSSGSLNPRLITDPSRPSSSLVTISSFSVSVSVSVL